MTPVVPSKDIAVEEAKKRGTDTDMYELTDNEINEIIKKFVNATELQIKAGYDDVEIYEANNNFIHYIQIKEKITGVVQIKKE